VYTASKANANGWGRVECTSADVFVTSVQVEVSVDPGGKNGNVNGCTGPVCGAAASVHEGVGEASQNCYHTVATAAANGQGLPAAYALICG
jgi:hypothetical protein